LPCRYPDSLIELRLERRDGRRIAKLRRELGDLSLEIGPIIDQVAPLLKERPKIIRLAEV